MNAVSGAFQSVSNAAGSMMGAPKVVPPQGNVPPAPAAANAAPTQTGGRSRKNRRNNVVSRKNRKNRRNNVFSRKNRKNRSRRN